MRFQDSEESGFIQTQAQEFDKSEQPGSAHPWWKSAAAGYGFVFPILAIAIGLTLVGEFLLPRFYFPSVFLLVAILCCSFVWGVGPGLLATLISCAALIYFYLRPLGELSLVSLDWELFFQIIPFAIAGLVVAVITGQREAARRRALLAVELAREHAEHLAATNEELQRVNQLKDFFLSVASHELKTPITTIRGQAQLALRRLSKHGAPSADTEHLREVFTKVDEQTRRLTGLVNDLLEFSSLRAGKAVLDIQPCDLNEICAKAVEEQHLVSGRVIELTQSSSPAQLQADPSRLGQVMTNLVGNALKYSPPESPVCVEVSCDSQFARVNVRDSGQGIPPEQLAHIFEPFYRTTEARTSTVGGTGLGLAICKDIIGRHHGRIWCESSVGSGSTFSFELPLIQPCPSKALSAQENLDASV